MIGLAASEITGARAHARRASNPDLRAQWRYTVKTNQRPVTPVRRIVVLPAIPLPLLLSTARGNRERKCGSRNRASKRITKDKRTMVELKDDRSLAVKATCFFPPFLSIIIVAIALPRVVQIVSRTNV